MLTRAGVGHSLDIPGVACAKTVHPLARSGVPAWAGLFAPEGGQLEAIAGLLGFRPARYAPLSAGGTLYPATPDPPAKDEDDEAGDDEDEDEAR